MDSVLALFTCFNRKEKTRQAVRGLVEGNPEVQFSFVIVDDASTDGTPEMLKTEDFGAPIQVIQGTGGLFYSGGMALGMEKILKSGQEAQYLLMMNDDVEFEPGCIRRLIAQSKAQGNAVIIGATCDHGGQLSYSAIKYEKGIHYRQLPPGETGVDADTMNANCVLIPFYWFRRAGVMDRHYRHSLGDFDYGLALRDAGAKLHVSRDYVGICCDNPVAGTWHDRSLGPIARIKKKETVKGDPAGPWFYYLRKHFGLFTAIRSSLTPYIRILLGL